MKFSKDTILTTGQVSEICRVVPKTVSKWVDSGRLTGYRIPGSRDRRVVLSDLLRFMRANGIPTITIEGDCRKILLLGKNGDAFQTLQHHLNNWPGYAVAHRDSLFNAGLTIEEFCPHVVFIDMNDDSLIPTQICRTIHDHRQFQYTRIVAICPDLSDGEVQALIQNGFDGILRRPFTSDQIKATIQKFTLFEH